MPESGASRHPDLSMAPVGISAYPGSASVREAHAERVLPAEVAVVLVALFYRVVERVLIGVAEVLALERELHVIVESVAHRRIDVHAAFHAVGVLRVEARDDAQ